LRKPNERDGKQQLAPEAGAYTNGKGVLTLPDTHASIALPTQPPPTAMTVLPL
jgi:hypothetical protein